MTEERRNGGILSVYHKEIPSFLFDMLQAESLKRIEQVGMHCGMEYTSFPFYRDLKRYDRLFHSLGVALIVYHFTAEEKQAYSGLFHDIATPCFSHVIDFLNHDYTRQESTEERTEAILSSDPFIQETLKKKDILLKEVINYHRYPIADNDSPYLSADRLEYTLSNFLNFSLCSLEQVKDFYDDLTVSLNEKGETELCFQSEERAEAFTLLTLKNSSYYISDEDRYGMEILARIMKTAIDRNVLSENDLYTTEKNVLSLLHKDPVSSRNFSFFQSLSRIRISKEEKPGYFRVPSKKRYIDPFVKGKGRITYLSAVARKEVDDFLKRSFEVYLSSDIQSQFSFSSVETVK